MMNEAVQIEAATGLAMADCRRLMLQSEPWITLGYTEADVQGVARGAETGLVLLARAAERVVGFALSASGVLLGEYLKVLVVEDAYQGSGVGRRLMAELERRAFQRWPNVYLCVSDFNHGARQFYDRLGYEEVGVLRDLVAAGHGEILMRKTIAAWRGFFASAG